MIIFSYYNLINIIYQLSFIFEIKTNFKNYNKFSFNIKNLWNTLKYNI